MINFCVEPKKPCRKNPIGELDFKIDKCYSSIYSRLCCHENDSVSHISQEERDEWNGKASNSALLDLQNQLNEIAGDGDNSIKKEILIEVSRQIAGAITDLNIEEYAKKKYVDDAISNIDFDQYVTKENADSTYLNKADYIKFDPTNYYTIAQIQKIIEDSTIGKDYPIESFTLEHNELILTQKNGGQFRVALSESVSDGGVNADYIQQQLLNYIKKNTLSKLIINDKVYSIESGRDIKIPTSGTGSSIDATKYGYNKFYFKKHPSNSVAPSKPSANRPPEDGSGWVDDAPNQEAGYYIWMTQVFINGNGQYGEYTNPICLTGTAGENAKQLSLEEVVIMDGDAIVAGMTSSKDIDSKSDLNGKVKNKGDVRIWAGKMQTAEDLTTAYTTIDSNGSIVMQNIQQGKSIKLNPQECSLKIVGPVSVLDDPVTDGTYIPSSDERIELANFEYTVDPGTLCSTIRLIMKSNGMITIDPGNKEISVYSDKDGTVGSTIGCYSIDMYDDDGNLYTSLNGIDIAGSDFVTLTSRHNKKGLHLRRINNASSDDILYILDGLPTSDPKIEGVLWMDSDRTLKVSSGGFGH